MAWRIVTPRLLLRGWEPADAPALLEAITSSLDHLRTWMAWAHAEPASLEEKVMFLQQRRSDFDRGIAPVYGIFDHDQDRVLGAIGAHPRIGAGAWEIGYWIRADCTRQGMMTEAAGALTRIGFEVARLRRIEIHCDPANLGSAGVPRRLGYRNALVMQNWVIDAKRPPRPHAIWTMLSSEYAASSAARAEIEAFDVIGRRLM